MRVTRMHLLVRRVKRTDVNLRLNLWRVVHAIEDRGATIEETATGRKSTDPRQRDDMISDAIETLTRSHNARAAKVARANGRKGGRPPNVLSDEQTAKARAAWFNSDLAGGRLLKTIRAAGYTRSRCYQEFGPRGGRT